MKRPAAAITRILAVLALFSCTTDTTGPSSNLRASLSIAPGLARAVLAQVAVDRVLVRFTRSDGTKALETVVAFPSGSDTLNVSLAVPLNGAAESFDLTLLLLAPSGDTVFRSGPTPVELKTGVAQPTVSVPPFIYSGVGANATGVRLVSKPATVSFGQTATFTAEAFDASGAVVPNAPIVWSSSDPTKASVPDGSVGTVLGGTTRGSVTVTASLLQTVPNTPPPTVATTLVVQPVASALVVQGGASQTGLVGAALAQPLRVRVNAVDNLGVQGVPVSFAVTSGAGTVATSQVLTDVNGDASVVWTLGNTAGAQTVSATVTGVAGATQSFSATATAGAAAKLVFTTNPSAVNAGATIAPTVVVEAQDSFGNTATGFTGPITIALGTSPSGSTLGGTTTVNAVSGVARFPDLTASTVGVGVTLVAASTGLTGATSAPFNVSPGAPAALVFSTQPSNGTAGSAIAPALTVTARDANGNTATSFVGTVTLALGTNPGGGALSGTTTATAVGGVATFAGISVAKAAAGYTLAASAAGLTTATSSAFTIAPAAASVLAFTTQPSAATAGATMTPAVVIEAQDSFGNTATSFTGLVSIALGSSPAGSTLGGTATVNAVNGVARFVDLSVSAVGTGVTLAATSSGLTAATSAPFSVSAGAPASLAFTTSPSSGVAGGVIAPAIIVTARDASGNTATSFVGAVTLALGANPRGDALSGTTTVTAVNGVATFSGISLTKATAGYTLTATATGLTGATSSTFTIAPASATTLVFTAQPTTLTAGIPIAPAVVVEARDGFGNVVTSFSGSVTIALGNTPAGGTLSGTTTVSAVSGVARFTDLTERAAATNVTFVATSSGISAATTTPFSVTAASAAFFTFTTQPSNGTAGSAIAPAIVVTAKDPSGNTATSFVGAVTLALAANPGSATLSGTTTVNAVGGVATFSGVTIGTAANGYTLSANATGVTSATSGAFNIAAATGSTLVFTTQPSNGTAGTVIAPAIVVTAKDATGNTATSFVGAVSLVIGANPGSGTLSGTTTVNAIGGVATFAGVTLGTAGAGYTLTATATGLANATSTTFTIVPAAASALTFTTPPSNATAGSAIAPAIVVTAKDVSGNVSTSFVGAVTLALGANPGSGTLSGTTTVNAVGGVATFSGLSIGAAAAGYTLTANATGLTGATSSAFTIAPASGSVLAFTTQPSNATAGSAISPSIVVTAKDASGNTATAFVGAVTLSIGANPASGTLSGTTTVNAVGGVATFPGIAIGAAAAGYTLTANATGVTSATSSAFTIAPAAATVLAFTTQPSNGTAGTAIAPAIVVTARDASGNTATSFVGAVTLAIGANPGSTTLSGTTTVNAVGGIATFTGVSLPTAAAGYTLSAAATGLTGTTSSAFTMSPAAASVLVVTTQPSNATAGSAIAPAIVVTARDPNGNTATTFVGAVTLALGANPGGGALSGTTTLNAVGGVATFSGVSLVKAAAGYTLTAAATGLAGATSSAFTIAPASASTLAFTTQPATSAAGAVISPPVVVSARDIFGNVATTFTGNVVVAIGANPGTSTLTGTTTVAAVAGVASFSNLSLTARGTGYTLTAAASGVTSATSAAFDISATTLAWTNASGGLWSTPSNWSLGRVPVGADSVVIAQPGTYTVTLDTTFSGSVLVVGGGSGTQTLALSSRTLSISGTMTVKATGAFSAASSTVAGSGTLVNQGVLSLNAANVAMAGGLTNQGTMIANAAVSVAGPLTTAAGSMLRVLADGSTGNASFSSANSFTNNGAIELTTASGGYPTALSVAGPGILTNAAGGTITSLVGAGGPRTIDAQLVNQGTVTVAQALTLTHVNASQTNSGTIDASAADLFVNQSPSPAAFTNTGTMLVGAGHMLTINGGTFSQNGTLSGAGGMSLSGVAASFGTSFTLANLTANGASLAFPAGQTTAGVVMNLVNSSVNGGAFTNAAGQTLNLRAVTFNVNVVNQGTIFSDAGTTVAASNTFANAAGALLHLEATGSTGNSTLTLPPFTNAGAIEMTTSSGGYPTALNVSGSGALTNAVGGTITSQVGAGGPRTISAQLVNQGVVSINQPLTLSLASAAHSNSGTIDASAGDLIVNQSGSPATFTNTGAMSVGSGHVVTFNGGTFSQNGSLTGTGTMSLSGVAASFGAAYALGALNVNGGSVAFPAGQTTTGVAMNLVNTSVNGGAFTNSVGQTLSLRSVTFNVNLVNQGTITSDAGSAVAATNTFANAAGALLHVEATGATGFSTLTLPPFTNAGAIEMTTTSGGYPTAVNVSGSGILTNAVGGTITSQVGNGGPRTIGAQLVNSGFVTVNQPLTLSLASAAHSNAGTIDATNGDLVVNQSGSPATFMNTGAITVGAGHVVTISGGAFTQNAALTGGGAMSLSGVAATFGGAYALAALNVNGGSVGFPSGQTTTGVAMNFVNTTVTGPGAFTNIAGQTLNLRSVAFNMNLVNQGTIFSDAGTSVGASNSFANAAGGLLHLEATGATGFSTLTLPAFTNAGAIEMTTSSGGYPTSLNVSGSGVLTNATGGTIATLVGNGGARAIGAQLVNAGTVNVAQSLTLALAGAAHSNSGSINLTGGDLGITQSGTNPSFTNTGTGSLFVGASRTLFVSGGTFTQSNALNGTGALSLSGVNANFGTSYTLANLSATNSTLTFPAGQTTDGVTMNLVGTTVGGSDLTNIGGQTMNVRNVTFTANFTNNGTLNTDGNTTASGTFANGFGSTLHIEATGSTGFSTLSVPSFSNSGTIEMTTSSGGYPDRLVVGGGSGTLTNGGEGGSIVVLTGAGGGRTINGNLNNQFGVVTLHTVPGPGTSLLVTGDFASTGTLNMELGGLNAGSQYSRLSVGGTATPGGTLNYALINGFTPTSGSLFDFLTAGAVTADAFFNVGSKPDPSWADPVYFATLVRLAAP